MNRPGLKNLKLRLGVGLVAITLIVSNASAHPKTQAPEAPVSQPLPASQESTGPVFELDESELTDEPVQASGNPDKKEAMGTGKTVGEGDLFGKKLITDSFMAKVGRKTNIGGYGEVVFAKDEKSRSQFESRRYILFVHSQMTDRISTTTEIEFEKGGSPEKRADGTLSHGEVLLEFSVVDMRIFGDWLNFRGGVLLVPFGMFNINHDSPTRDLTDRPLAYRTIVPTTWFEAGMGFFGQVETSDTGNLNYEVYLMNGLDSQIVDGLGYRQARGSLGPNDNNDNKAIAGRLGYSPYLGLELGLSGYKGEYDRDGHEAKMLGLDLLFKHRWFEFLGEYVEAFNDPGFVVDGGASSPIMGQAVPENMRGWYAQTNFHFMPFPRDWLAYDLQDSIFTGVIRYEQVDTNTEITTESDITRLTLGLNFRPVEAVVFKSDLLLNYKKIVPGIEAPSKGFRFSASFLF
jgi:hypothetical protein